MTGYFAYGANLDRSRMRELCPNARLEGLFRLDGWRFLIMKEGWATIARNSGSQVWGLVWLLSEADVASLDEFEGVAEGLYQRRKLRVPDQAPGRRSLEVYLGRSSERGVPVPGYIPEIVGNLSSLGAPEGYVREIEMWDRLEAAAL